MSMDNKTFLRRMLALALPIALQNLLSSCGYLVDTAMVVGLGNAATSAIGVATRWSFFMNVALFGVCSGCSTLVAQYWGAGRREEIRRTTGLAFAAAGAVAAFYIIMAFCFSTRMMRLFTAETAVIEAGAAYIPIASFNVLLSGLTLVAGSCMRATEDVRSPFIASSCGVFVNTFLNYCLIYGHFGLPRLGLRGAALATAASGAVQLTVILTLAVRRRSVFLGRPSELFRWSGGFIRRYISVAAPILGNEVMWALGMSIYAMILARQGSESYSAYTIANSVKEIFFVFFVGLCNACAIMVGKVVGEDRPDEAYRLARRFLIAIPLMSAVLGALEIAARVPILSLMDIETEGARLTAARLLLLEGLLMPLVNLPYIAVVGIFRAGGDTKYGFFADTVSVYGLGIPTLAALAFFTETPFVLLILAMNLSENILKSALCLRRFRSRRWIRRLV